MKKYAVTICEQPPATGCKGYLVDEEAYAQILAVCENRIRHGIGPNDEIDPRDLVQHSQPLD